MTARQKLGFQIWTAVLSVFMAVALFPSIIGKHGVWISLLITALAVGAIWMMYFIIGRLIDWLVLDELKRKGKSPSRDEPGPKE